MRAHRGPLLVSVTAERKPFLMLRGQKSPTVHQVAGYLSALVVLGEAVGGARGKTVWRETDFNSEEPYSCADSTRLATRSPI